MVTSLQDDFISKGGNCDCCDRIRFNLPCHCIISDGPDILPLSIVDMHWRFERDKTSGLKPTETAEVANAILPSGNSLCEEIISETKVLVLAKSSLEDPAIKMNELKQPSVNTKRKGRKAKQVPYVSHYDRVQTYTDREKDTVFEWIDIKPIEVVAAIHNVGADGNCGFCAISFNVYKDQSRWIKVKHDMFETYLKYCDTLYRPVEDNAVEIQKAQMIKRLNSTKSPCFNGGDQSIWFSTFSCPPVVADTYERPLKNAEHPIALLLAHYHFYYVEFNRTPTGRLKTFFKPAPNMDHHQLRKSYPDICSKDDHSILYRNRKSKNKYSRFLAFCALDHSCSIQNSNNSELSAANWYKKRLR
ncbi:hypothetical protein MFLAVUS_009789 [Mucor flavus]|uniref:OTU domain-containing protein n=1 Tax=Mucor flavus TaxID=439312 RepID=A0ABP9ZAW6_9FUNG